VDVDLLVAAEHPDAEGGRTHQRDDTRDEAARGHQNRTGHGQDPGRDEVDDVRGGHVGVARRPTGRRSCILHHLEPTARNLATFPDGIRMAVSRR
jgi:hypothetical protein